MTQDKACGAAALLTRGGHTPCLCTCCASGAGAWGGLKLISYLVPFDKGGINPTPLTAKNPILLAREVMQGTPRVLLAGPLTYNQHTTLSHRPQSKTRFCWLAK